MLQKLFLTGIIALIFPGRDLQVVVVVLADLGFLCVLLIMKPHTHGPLRNLALAASVAITLTMYCGLVLRTVDGVASNVKYRTAIDIFLVTMNGSVACYALKHIIPFALLYGLCKKKEKKKAKARIFRRSNTSVKQIKKKKDSSDKIVRSLTSPSQGTNVMKVKESNMLKGNRTKIAPSSSGFSFFKVFKEAQEKAEKNVTNDTEKMNNKVPSKDFSVKNNTNAIAESNNKEKSGSSSSPSSISQAEKNVTNDTEKMNNKVPSKDFSVKNNTNAIAESNNKEKSGSSSSPSSISQFSRSARDFSFFKDFKEAQKQAEKNVTNSTAKMNNEVPSNDFSVKNNTNSIAGSIKNDDIKLILGEFTDTLLEYQNNLLERTNTGKTILIIASQMGKIELVKTFLLFRATDINSRSNNGCTALWYAVKNRNNDVVKYLLESGADPNINHTGNGATPLHVAVHNKFPDIVKVLIEHGADANIRDKMGSTPILIASQFGCNESLQALIDAGCNLKCSISQGENAGGNPAFCAAYGNNVETLQLLLNVGVNVNGTTKDGRSPLFIACENGNLENVHLLVEHGAEINLPKISDGRDITSVAHDCHNDEVYLYIIAHKSNSYLNKIHGISNNSSSKEENNGDNVNDQNKSHRHHAISLNTIVRGSMITNRMLK